MFLFWFKNSKFSGLTFIGKTRDKAVFLVTINSSNCYVYVVRTVMSKMSEQEEIMKLRRENIFLLFNTVVNEYQ